MTGNTTLTETSPTLREEYPSAGRPRLQVIAEGLHIMNQRVCAALAAQDDSTLTELARHHLEGGAQALAVNLGPGRAMARLTPWVTETLRRELTAPLFLSAGALAFPELLRRHGKGVGINAVTADPATLVPALDITGESGSPLAVLLVRPGLTPAGSTDRLALAAEVIDLAQRRNFPLRRLYLDPLLTLRPDPLAWRISRGLPDLAPVAECIAQIRLLDEGPRTLVALGNCASSGDQRPGLQASILSVLVEAGLDAVLLDGRNQALLQACRRLVPDSPREEPISRAA